MDRGGTDMENHPGESMRDRTPSKTSIVLLSGGIDSSTVLAVAQDDGFAPQALTFSYWQRHTREVEAARNVSSALGVREHRVVRLNLGQIGGSALTSRSVDVPLNRSLEKISEGIPATYVPARNTIFLSMALAWAESRDADAIYIGASAVDFSGYPDCRPEYYAAFQRVAQLGTKRGVEGNPIEIRHPLIAMSKAEIIKKAQELGVPMEMTWSCYVGREKACGQCDACQIRLNGFKEAGIADPISYEKYPKWYEEGTVAGHPSRRASDSHGKLSAV